jgi:hypothetical protein
MLDRVQTTEIIFDVGPEGKLRQVDWNVRLVGFEESIDERKRERELGRWVRCYRQTYRGPVGGGW